jgi:hypothetical protein
MMRAMIRRSRPRSSAKAMTSPAGWRTDALGDPEFHDHCAAMYADRFIDVDPPPASPVGYTPFHATPVEPPAIPQVLDESLVRAHDQSWIDPLGIVHPERWFAAAVRVGRVVTMIESPKSSRVHRQLITRGLPLDADLRQPEQAQRSAFDRWRGQHTGHESDPASRRCGRPLGILARCRFEILVSRWTHPMITL